MPEEIRAMEWRPCVGFPDYEVSECGDVRRVRGSRTRRKGWRLRGFIDHDGYIRFALLDAAKEKRIVIGHRLVAEAFIGPSPGPEYEVAHNNGSRISNHYTNLRWATRKENDDDMIVHGTTRSGIGNGNAKLTEADVRAIRAQYMAIKNREVSGLVSDLAKSYGIHHASLIRIAIGKSWAHIQ